MAGLILKNALSENRAVTRSICEINKKGRLTAVHDEFVNYRNIRLDNDIIRTYYGNCMCVNIHEY